jgi:hypothetical protein
MSSELIDWSKLLDIRSKRHSIGGVLFCLRVCTLCRLLLHLLLLSLLLFCLQLSELSHPLFLLLLLSLLLFFLQNFDVGDRGIHSRVLT